MLVIRQRIAARPEWQAELELTYDARSKSRLRCFSSSGEDVGLFLERGQPPLADGECLLAADGRVVRVRARPEQLLHVTCASAFELTRAAYHLGNRHVPLQIMPGELRYHHDHVLDDMLRPFGLEVTFDSLPFEPEAGAYASDAHSHSHSHAHSH